MRVWIDCDSEMTIGTVGYLVETVVAGRTSWSLHDQPPEPGWSWAGRVVRRHKKRKGRVQVLRLHGEERLAACMRLRQTRRVAA